MGEFGKKMSECEKPRVRCNLLQEEKMNKASSTPMSARSTIDPYRVMQKRDQTIRPYIAADALMKSNTATLVFAVAIAFCLFSLDSSAQTPGLTPMQGVITSANSRRPVESARISARNTATGATLTTVTGADGKYVLSAVTPGDYGITVDAAGFTTKTFSITVNTRGAHTFDFSLAELPSAPSANPAAPSLNDLGFSAEQTQANPQLQIR